MACLSYLSLKRNWIKIATLEKKIGAIHMYSQKSSRSLPILRTVTTLLMTKWQFSGSCHAQEAFTAGQLLAGKCSLPSLNTLFLNPPIFQSTFFISIYLSIQMNSCLQKLRVIGLKYNNFFNRQLEFLQVSEYTS